MAFALCTLLLALSPLAAIAVYDFGPVKAYHPTFVEGQPVPAGQGPNIVAQGFPAWYRDDYGNICEPCTVYDPQATATCLSTYDGLNPDNPTAPPSESNLPDEFFYYHTSAVITYGANLDVMWEAGVEGAYGTGPRLAGDEMVFQRVRFVIDCPGTKGDGKKYRFILRTPYNRAAAAGKYEKNPYYEFVSENGGPRCIFQTFDVGITPGKFGESLSGPIDVYMDGNSAGRVNGMAVEGQRGNFPDAGTNKIKTPAGNEIIQEFIVESDAFVNEATAEVSTHTGMKLLKTTALTSSCKLYTGPVFRPERAVLRRDGASQPTIEVWATGQPGLTITAGIKGISLAKTLTEMPSNSAITYPVPNNFQGSTVYYYIKFPLPTGVALPTKDERTGYNQVLLTAVVGSGGTVKTATAELSLMSHLSGSATFDGTNLQVTYRSSDQQEVPALLMRSQGSEEKQLTPSSAITVGEGSISVAVNSPPDVLHVCHTINIKKGGTIVTQVDARNCVPLVVNTASTVVTAATDFPPEARFNAPSVVNTDETIILDATQSYPLGCDAVWSVETATNATCGTLSDVPEQSYQKQWKAPPTAVTCKITLKLTCGPVSSNNVTANIEVKQPQDIQYTLMLPDNSNIYPNIPFGIIPTVTRNSDQVVIDNTKNVTFSSTQAPGSTFTCNLVLEVSSGSLRCTPTGVITQQVRDTASLREIKLNVTASVLGSSPAPAQRSYTVNLDTMTPVKAECAGWTTANAQLVTGCRITATSAAAPNVDGVTMTVYYTNDQRCPDLACAKKYFTIARDIPCPASGLCAVGTSGLISSMPTTTATLMNAPKSSTRFLFFETNAGAATSLAFKLT